MARFKRFVRESNEVALGCLFGAVVWIVIGLIASKCSAKEPVCVLEKVVKKQVCKEEKHPIAGAGIGWLVFGPLGAVAGAVIGSNPDRHCEDVEERVCLEWKTPKSAP